MFLPKDVRCLICSKIFCCSKCRIIHEKTIHINSKNICEKVNFDCVICRGEKFTLHKITSDVLIDHIVKEHLPLKCNKCFKHFTKKNHFKEFDLCNKKLNSVTANKENMESILKTIHENEIQTKNCETNIKIEITQRKILSPFYNQNIILPRLESDYEKSLMKFESQSNLSISKDYGPVEVRRTTSTPMQDLSNDNQKPQTTFNSSSCHMSSIGSIRGHFTNSSSDIYCESSPSLRKILSDNSIDYNSGGIRKAHKIKLSVAASPLRQVMSKSIQRAIAQHGIHNMYKPRNPSKLMIDSSAPLERSNSCPVDTAPLDLRTSPVVRRSISMEKESMLEIEKSSENKFHKKLIENEDNHKHSMMTPKYFNSNPQMIAKKVITFTSPPLESCQKIKENDSKDCDIKSNQLNVDDVSLNLGIDESINDVWYTPCTTPMRSFSCSDMNMKKTNYEFSKEYQTTPFVNYDDQMKNKNDDHDKDNLKGKLWNFVTSVMKMATNFKGGLKRENDLSKSSLQKCASFSGVVETTNNYTTDEPQSKRQKLGDNYESCNFIKRKRIQGRLPINRLRKQ